MANPNAYELARIYGIGAIAALRGGELTDQQKRKLKKLQERGLKRDGKK